MPSPRSDPSATTSTRPGPAPGRQRLSAQARKDQLLDAAADVLTANGVDGFTIDAITDHAGVDRTLVHYHFKSRDGLVLALYEREHARMAQLLEAAMAVAGPDGEARVRALAHAWMDLEASQAVITAFEGIQTESGEVEAARRRHAWDGLVFVADELARGYGLDRDSAQVVAAIVLAASTTLVAAWRVSGWTRERIENLFVDMMVAAIERAASDAKPEH